LLLCWSLLIREPHLLTYLLTYSLTVLTYSLTHTPASGFLLANRDSLRLEPLRDEKRSSHQPSGDRSGFERAVNSELLCTYQSPPQSHRRIHVPGVALEIPRVQLTPGHHSSSHHRRSQLMSWASCHQSIVRFPSVTWLDGEKNRDLKHSLFLKTRDIIISQPFSAPTSFSSSSSCSSPQHHLHISLSSHYQIFLQAYLDHTPRQIQTRHP